MSPTPATTRFLIAAAVLALSCFIWTTASADPPAGDPPETHFDQVAQEEAAAFRAIATLSATEGNTVSGTATFLQVEGGIEVTANLTGLTPGDHGFHVHQYGDCSAADGTSAAGHFNPGSMDHGGPDAETRHVGDLGNITADEDGNAVYSRVDTHLRFDGDGSIVGRGLIVHGGTDDLTSQPTGAAGPRVACGVIGVAAPQ